MPITKSAKKAIRSAAKKRVFNLRRTKVMKDVVKEVKQLNVAGKASDAQALLPKAFQAIDKAVKRGVIKKGNADRKKSRLVKLITAKKDEK